MFEVLCILLLVYIGYRLDCMHTTLELSRNAVVSKKPQYYPRLYKSQKELASSDHSDESEEVRK